MGSPRVAATIDTSAPGGFENSPTPTEKESKPPWRLGKYRLPKSTMCSAVG
jgi:hypothetical protein